MASYLPTSERNYSSPEESSTLSQPQERLIPEKLCNLPPLNAVATRVIALSADPEVDFHEISSTIKSDPAFAADLLFLANSPLFGCGTTMVDLNRAIAQLGIPRVQVLAVTIAMRAFKSGSATANRMWQHSVAAAVVSEKLAKPMRLAPAEAYTSGLMHDIGRLGLLKTYPKQSEAVLACDDVAPAELLQLERAALKVQHTEAGGWLIQAWGLPGYVGDICRHHHDPPDAQDNPRLLVAKGACMIADALGYSVVKYRGQRTYAEVIESAVPGLRSRDYPDEDTIRKDTESRLQMSSAR